MQPLIHKASLTELFVDPHRLGLMPGDIAHLKAEDDGSVTVYHEKCSGLPFGFGKPGLRRIGKLGPKATALILPALASCAQLRVRIADVEFAHINPTGSCSVSISVWGHPSDLDPELATD
ncbi:hypothetical protein [Marivita geojedonensis]|uniref:Uncharacterized protein n=1 Tax=Marivita geojedonensis TaxID=1123756 RepID=A0A1X4NCE3_9RHOB|nr:hypothetical protein [Marivita geojedonensis]OSQ44328.1 hypothetical protein MGEO_19135 [Marivita geojedonensis]PRY72900.1 hypothetical protein CLV76_13212 [Marivita geojedonensis]